MLDFIYDSLDTVKKLKFPTIKQITKLTVGIFVLVVVAGAYFILIDTLFSEGYKGFYNLMTGKEISPTNTISTEAASEMLNSALTTPTTSEEAVTTETPEVNTTPEVITEEVSTEPSPEAIPTATAESNTESTN